jgi:hypothetical protein
MPFENEEGYLQKLNTIVQFVFLNLNSLHIDPLPSTFKKNFKFSSCHIQYYKNFSI